MIYYYLSSPGAKEQVCSFMSSYLAFSTTMALTPQEGSCCEGFPSFNPRYALRDQGNNHEVIPQALWMHCKADLSQDSFYYWFSTYPRSNRRPWGRSGSVGVTGSSDPISHNPWKKKIFPFPQCIFLQLMVVGSLGEGLGNPYHKNLLWCYRVHPQGLFASPSISRLWS